MSGAQVTVKGAFTVSMINGSTSKEEVAPVLWGV